MSEHKRLSPFCPFVADSSFAAASLSVLDVSSESANSHAPINNSKSRYMNYDARLETFRNWPWYMHQKREDMAAAGFYYKGMEPFNLRVYHR